MKFHGLAAIALLIGVSACTGQDAAASAGNEAAKAPLTTVTVTSQTGRHVFKVEMARTPAEQERGLMFRTDIPKDGGMLFAPYPADGGGPREASFWMKNTPSPLDIIFVRADGTIARIAENTVPFSEAQVPSGEPVAAVLEINGGRSAELGISEGDKVSWK
jgi:hypothetical protein